MKNRLLFSLLLAVLSLGRGMAQDRAVSGKVSASDDGSPLPGASVVVKGTTQGTTTDANGNYRVSVPTNATLVFTAVGFARQEVEVGARSTLDVTLSSDAQQLSEVVVVGYGTIERKNVTGAQTSVKGAAIATLATPSFDQQLAGRAAGVQVTVPNGLVGQAPRIRIRGTNSISSGADPLVVIDNVPVANNPYAGAGPANPLGDINPADIESIEILKDGASTAIFGSRAANGVILITTKRGRSAGGRMAVNYNTYLGINQPVNKLDLLNASEFIQIANEKYTNAGQPIQAVAGKNGEDTDWQSVILRTGKVQSHALSLSGSTEKTNYLLSLGYLSNRGQIVANDQTRYTVRANFDHSVTDWLTVGSSLSYSYSKFNNLNTGGNALSGNVAGAARLLPNVSPYLDPSDPNYTRFEGYNITPDGAALGQGANLRPVDNNYTNIAFVLAKNKFQTYNTRFIGNAYAEAQVVKGLKLRTQIAVDQLNQEDFVAYDPRHGDGRGSNGYAYQQYRPVTLWNWQNTATYNNTFADVHNLNVVVGLEYQKRTSKVIYAEGRGFSELFFLQNNLIGGTYTTQASDGGFVQDAFDSYFGRINYNYVGKYYLSLTARNDGLSSLPLANRRGTFPGGSLAWRVSKESFFEGIQKVVSDLRLRASYAVVGNTNIGFFPYLGTFGAAQYASQTGIAFSNTGNPDLKWEQSKKLNFGLDLGFLNDRITFSADYFVNQIDNLVLFAPTAASLGVPGNGINKNIGKMENKGIELQVRARVLEKAGFSWDVDANFTALKNKITALNNDADIINTYHINRVGQPIGSFYGYAWAGVNPANGNPMWYKGDGKGNLTDQIVQYNIVGNNFRLYNPASPGDLTQAGTLSSTTDRVILGNSNPTWLGGLTNTFRFKGFDLEIFTRFSGGNKVMNVTRQETLLNQGFQNNGREILQRWTTEGQVTNVPKLWINRDAAINNTGAADSRFLEKGDFVRIQNIVLGYTFPKAFVAKSGKLGIRSLRLYAQVQNAFTFTKYTGLDPELSSSTANSTYGFDQNSSPITRTSSVGLSLGF